MGEGLKRARKAARATRKPQPKVLMVTDSCGCVFCDLDVASELVRIREGEWQRMHVTKSGKVVCNAS